ncbi:MAG: DUF4266 domain-containing protein [Methyloglobulus sp.]|nr:DUF4266 domain-containing protein [Methyloglobulus sp.]
MINSISTIIILHSYIQVAGCSGFISTNTLKLQRIGLTDLCFVYNHVILFIATLPAAFPSVQPWERGNFAKSQIALDPYPLQSTLRAHNYGSREAAAGGNAAQGGGRGCY